LITHPTVIRSTAAPLLQKSCYHCGVLLRPLVCRSFWSCGWTGKGCRQAWVVALACAAWQRWHFLQVYIRQS